MTALPSRPRRGRSFGYAHVIASIAGVGFFAFSFILLAVLPGRQLGRQIAETAPIDMPAYTVAEQHGAAIFAREGCTNCHSEFVRFIPADVARWGAPTEAWETQYDYPQLWGTRRTGPDLAREAGIRSDDWQLVHLFNPRMTVKDSIMPGYPWLFEGTSNRPTEEGRDLVAYLQSLGRAGAISGYEPGQNPLATSLMGMVEGAVNPTLLSRPDANAARATINGPTRHFLSVLEPADQPDAVSHGSELFAHNCASCHGTTGGGDGPGASGLLPRPANLKAARFSDERISSALWNGVAGSSMPAWRDLSNNDLASLVAYVRSLHPAAAEPRSATDDVAGGKALFDKHCTTCHGSDGAGSGPAAPTIAPRPTDFHLKQPDTERAMEVLDKGAPGTSMPSWKTVLSEADRRQVVAYVRSLYVRPEAGGVP